MYIGTIFWVLMLLWLVFGHYFAYGYGGYIFGGSVLFFVLFCLLGWANFGPQVKR